MRTIKFRALKDDMSDFSFVYGDLIYDNGVPRIKVENCMLFTTCLKGTEGQFTGLLDKNGKEIYEGDIVKLHLGCEQMDITEYKIVCEIGYGKMGHGSEIGFTGYSKQGQHFSLPYEGAIEIIGNVHENADLLK